MNFLPKEIIDIILEFQGYHIYRNGKYITRLNIDDKIYDELKRKPMIKRYKNNSYKTIFQKKNYIYFISTSIYSNKVHWYMDIYDYRLIGQKIIEKSYHYVYGHNDKQNLPLIINYNK